MTSDRCILNVKVGCWEDQLTVIVHNEDVSSFVENGMAEGCKFIVDDEMVLLYADPDGVHMSTARFNGVRDTSDPYTKQFNLYTGDHGQEINRFALCELEATLDPDGLTIELPAIYDLPWPHVQALDRTHQEGVCVREFRRRIAACARDQCQGLHVPNRIRRCIPADGWRSVIVQFKKDLCHGFTIS